MLRTAALVLFAALSAAPAADAAAHRPDLVVAKLSVPTAATAPGTLRVSLTTTNAGKASAKPSVTQFFLVAPPKKTGKKKVAVKVTSASLKLATTAPVAALAVRRAAKATVVLQLPASIPTGTYVLVACADRAGAVRESNESNNCRAAATTTAIKRVATSAAGGPAAPTTTTTASPPAPAATPAPTPTPVTSAAEQQATTMISAVDGQSSVAGIDDSTAHLLDYLGIAVAGDGDATGGGPASRRGAGRDATSGPIAGMTEDPADLLGDGLDVQDRASGIGRISLSELAQDLTVVSGSLAATTTDGDGNPASLYTSGSGQATDDPLLPSASARFQQFLADSLATAREHPTAPASAPIFVLAQFARSQTPSIDIADPSSYDPDDLLLGGGDLLAFVSNVVQMTNAIIDNPFSTRAARTVSGTPCSDVKSMLDQATQFAGQTWAYSAAKATGLIEGEYAKDLANLVGADGEAFAAGLSKVQSALSIVAKIQAVIELYRDAKVHLSVAQPTIAAPGPPDADAVDPVTATAGIDDAEWNDFKANDGQVKQAVSDCLNTLGFPTLTGVGDIGAASSSWRAAWDLKGGELQTSLSHNPDFVSSSPPQKQFHSINDHQATSVFTPDVVHQAKEPEPGDQTVSETDYVTVGVRTDPPVTASTLMGVVDGSSAADGTVIGDPFGLAAAVTEQLTRLYEGLNVLKANVPITVTHTIPADGTWTGEIQMQTHTHTESDHYGVGPTGPGSTLHESYADDMKVTSFVEVNGSVDPSYCAVADTGCSLAATAIAGYQHTSNYYSNETSTASCVGTPNGFVTSVQNFGKIDTIAHGNGGTEPLPSSGGDAVAIAVDPSDDGTVSWTLDGNWGVPAGTSKTTSVSTLTYGKQSTDQSCRNQDSPSTATGTVDSFEADSLHATGTFNASTKTLHIGWAGYVDPPTDQTKVKVDLTYHGRPFWQDPPSN